MKRIIAAALSVLVGAFGYTIVDKALENRVTALESEVVELRGEVSKYHPEYTADNNDGTTEPESEFKLEVGQALKESSNSIHKFLIREYSNGLYKYISSNNYEPVTFVNKTTNILTTAVKPSTTKLTDSTNYDDPYDDPRPSEAYTGYPVAEYYLYLTDCSAYISDIQEDVSYSYGYDNDYSQVSKPIVSTYYYLTIKYKGYADKELAGKSISFSVYPNGEYCGWFDKPSSPNNIINSDGSFSFEDTYMLHTLDGLVWFCVDSVSIR